MDFLKWFLQYHLSEDTQPEMVVVTLDESGSKLQFWRQMAMPMGASPSSSIAQRGLEGLLHIFGVNFDKEEQHHLAAEAKQEPQLKAFLAARGTLSLQTGRNESKLHTERGFTDDVCILCVGIDRMYQPKECCTTPLGPGEQTSSLHLKRKSGAHST